MTEPTLGTCWDNTCVGKWWFSGNLEGAAALCGQLLFAAALLWIR